MIRVLKIYDKSKNMLLWHSAKPTTEKLIVTVITISPGKEENSYSNF